uniref:Uncharacterized protein n=1 Tax=Ciona savignyi TaxID=51511 RepID=H2YM89_CIOSA
MVEETKIKLLQDDNDIEKNIEVVTKKGWNKNIISLTACLQIILFLTTWVLLLCEVFGNAVDRCRNGEECFLSHWCEVALLLITITHYFASVADQYWVVTDILRILQIGGLFYLKNIVKSSYFNPSHPSPLYFACALVNGLIFAMCFAPIPGHKKKMKLYSGIFLMTTIIGFVMADMIIQHRLEWSRDDYISLVALPLIVLLIDTTMLACYYRTKNVSMDPGIILMGGLPVFYLTLPLVEGNSPLQVGVVTTAVVSYLSVAIANNMARKTDEPTKV